MMEDDLGAMPAHVCGLEPKWLRSVYICIYPPPRFSAGRDQFPASSPQAPTQTTRTQDPGGNQDPGTKTQEGRVYRAPPPFPRILNFCCQALFSAFFRSP